MKPIHIDPPHVSAAYFFRGADSTQNLLEVCRRVLCVGLIKPVAIEYVQNTLFPQFARISDLSSQLESMRCDSIHQPSQEFQIVRVTLQSRDAGTVAVAFDAIPDRVIGAVAHPIASTVSGALLAMPLHAVLTARERRSAAKTALFLGTVFRKVCEELDPLYGGIQIETPLPTPSELVCGDGHVGTELFVSMSLSSIATNLDARLSRIFADGFRERWATGTFYSGWRVFNSAGRSVERPLAMGAQAARALGEALRHIAEAGS
jgi:hypothetical protein